MLRSRIAAPTGTRVVAAPALVRPGLVITAGPVRARLAGVRLVLAVFVLALGGTACGGRAGPAASSAGSASPSSSVVSAPSPDASPDASAAPPSAPSAGSSPGAGAGTPVARRPAAAAGGACGLLTFESVARAVGTAFDVAAGSGRTGESQTCVLQAVGSTAPDLVLTVTPAPGVTAATYRESYVPAGGTALSGIGEAAYRRIVGTGTAGGPRVEIGWLSRSGRVLTLAYTMGRQEEPHHTTQVAERLVLLGTQVDRAG